MPSINRKPIRAKQPEYKHEKREEVQKYYNSPAWTLLRRVYFMEHPICEICTKYHVVTPADDIHHKIPFMTGATEGSRWDLFLNKKNLMSLCNTCHHALHTKAKQYNLTLLDDLTEKEYREAHGKE